MRYFLHPPQRTVKRRHSDLDIFLMMRGGHESALSSSIDWRMVDAREP
jgi:hypothetical protein